MEDNFKKIRVCLNCDSVLLIEERGKSCYCGDKCKRNFYYKEMSPEKKAIYLKKGLARAMKSRKKLPRKPINTWKFLKYLTEAEIIKINELREARFKNDI